MIKVYTQEFIDFLREITPGKRSSEVAKLAAAKYPDLNLTQPKIRQIMSRYKIRSGVKCGNEPRWTEEHFDFLRKFVPGHNEKEIQQALFEKFGEKTSINNIGNLKKKAGVKSGTVGGQFQKGIIPFTKGKKWSEFMSEEGQKKSLKTCFKKGNVPANRKEIGYERVDHEGFVYVKVQDLHQNRNFKQKHYLVWEQHNGPVPKGYILRFLDGNRQNCDISNLALVSVSEKLILSKMQRTTNPELHKTQILVAQVMDKARKRKRKDKTQDKDYNLISKTCALFDISTKELEVHGEV